jgi:hypothetical protein
MGDDAKTPTSTDKSVQSQPVPPESPDAKSPAIKGKSSVKDNIGKSDCGPVGSCVKGKTGAAKKSVEKDAGTAK